MYDFLFMSKLKRNGLHRDVSISDPASVTVNFQILILKYFISFLIGDVLFAISLKRLPVSMKARLFSLDSNFPCVVLPAPGGPSIREYFI